MKFDYRVKPRAMSRVFLFVRAKLLNVRYWHLADIATPTNQCPLSGVKRTSCGIVAMSANDPKPTSMFCGQCTRIVQGSASGLKYSDRCCMNWTVTAAKPQSCGCLFWRDRREAVFLFAAPYKSAFGTKRTSLFAPHMSAFGGKADIVCTCRNCRLSGPDLTLAWF